MQKQTSSAILLLTLTLLTGCGGNGAFNQPSSNAQLTVAPAAMTFGSVRVGSTKTLTGTLKASGGGVVVSTAEWNGAGYSVSGVTFPLTLSKGETVSFHVTFTPAASGATNGKLTFVTDSAVNPISQTLTGSGAPHVVSLSWSPSTSAVIGYNVYRGTQSGGPYSRLNLSLLSATAYEDGTVLSGLTYFYVLRSVSSASVESSASNQATATVP